MKNIFTLLFSLFVYLATSGNTLAEKRVALVVGMSNYEYATPLKNTSNDAKSVADRLKSLGFEVVEGADLTRVAFGRKIRDFSASLKDADVALFYYAGHGLQVNGKNYLAPVDARLENEADLDFEAISLNLVLRQMQRTTPVALVFLDACRNNPLARTLARSLGNRSRSVSIGRGLARVQEASGMLISFATQPGNVALDGNENTDNSPFTTALLRHMGTQGATVNDVMIEVRKEVMTQTRGRQVPWESSSLTGKFYFNPPAEQKMASLDPSAMAGRPAAGIAGGSSSANVSRQVLTVTDETVDLTFWNSIKESDNPKLFKEYIRRFPKGTFVPIAEAEIEAIRKKEAALLAKADEPAANRPDTGTKVAHAGGMAGGVSSAARPEVPTMEASPYFGLDAPQIAAMQQSELKRLGCLSGNVDGIWGYGSRKAMARFNGHASTNLPVHEPMPFVIDTLKKKRAKICPLICRQDQIKRNGVCRQKPRIVRRQNNDDPGDTRRPRFNKRQRETTQQEQERNAAGDAAVSAFIGGVVGGLLGAKIGKDKR